MPADARAPLDAGAAHHGHAGLASSGGRTVGYAERARFYDVEYPTTADQSFLRSLVTRSVAAILEIPCGAGRNVGWLADSGRRVVCADRELTMVERTAERVRALGAERRVFPLVADMRDVCFRRGFNLILVPQEAFQLLIEPADARRALLTLGEQLGEGGVLLVDLCTFTVAGRGDQDIYPDYFDPRQPDGKLLDEWTREVDSEGQLSRGRVQHSGPDTILVDYHYALVGRHGQVSRWHSEITLRTYDLESFSSLAAAAGLRIDKAFRDYSGTPFEPGAGRMLLLLSRAHETTGGQHL